jgi:diguanylate cyclase (GGDEF)-like protein
VAGTGSRFGGARRWRLGTALGAVGVAALVAVVAPGDSVVPLLYALPVLVAALVLVAPEAAIVALVALILFLVAIGLNDNAHFFPSVLPLAVLCVVALLLSGRHRDERAESERAASSPADVSAEAALLGLVAVDLAATLDLPTLLDEAARQLVTTMGASRCVIMIGGADDLRLAARVGAPPVAGMPLVGRLPLSTERIAALRESLYMTAETEGVDAGALAAADIEAAIVLPLVAHGEPLGLAIVDEPGRVVEFPRRLVSLGMAIASFVALMVNNARLYERQANLTAELRERSATNEALLRLGNELRVTLDLDEVLDKLSRTVIDALGYHEVSVFLFDDETDSFVARIALGGAPELNTYVLATPIPRPVFMRLMEPDLRMGNSFHRSLGGAPPSDDEALYFPCTDLGERADDEWQTGDTLFTPLTAPDGAIIGVLDVYDPHDRRKPTMESVHTLEIFANQAAIAIQNATQFRRLREQEERLARELNSQRQILHIGESMLATLDEAVVFESIADTLAELVAYDTLSISKTDWENGLIRTAFARDEYAAEIIENPIRIDEGLTGWAVTRDEAILSNDVLNDPRAVAIPGTPDDEPQASIVVPLRGRSAVIGVLNLDRLGGATYTTGELETAKLFASLAAIAIENAALYENSQLRAVTDALTGLYDHGHFQETLEREIRRCERYGETFSLLMMDLDRFKVVNDRFGHPRGDVVLQEVSSILKDTSRESDYVARYGGEEFALLLPNTSAADGCALAERIRERVCEVTVAPGDSFHVSASVGVADFPACGLDARTVLSASDTALLWAKRRGRNCVLYYRDVREMVVAPLPGDVGDTFWASGLEALVATVDAKTTFREHHGDAVAGMVLELAQVAGCLPEEAALFEVAARMHDVGKVGIATGILEKSGGLSMDELDELKRHVEVGAEILKNADAPRELIPVIRHHHERWDGLGYPDGLRGEEIPLGARMIAICDAFQAMLCDRPYRQARSLADARAEIARGGGSQFDPALAHLFLEACAASGAPSVCDDLDTERPTE